MSIIIFIMASVEGKIIEVVNKVIIKNGFTNFSRGLGLCYCFGEKKYGQIPVSLIIPNVYASYLVYNHIIKK